MKTPSEHGDDGTRHYDDTYQGVVFVCLCGEPFVAKNDLERHIKGETKVTCHRCEEKKQVFGQEVYTLEDLAHGVYIQFDVESALAYAKDNCTPQEFDDEFVCRLLVINLGSFCAAHVPHTNPDLPGLIATVYPTETTVSFLLIDGTHRTVRNCQMPRKPLFYVLSPEESQRFIITESRRP
jgi:hypothetical protein